ncbi:Sodium-driven chloride bicarbonate exchanger [Trichinella pseudospiralis]|uniref:Anion exchange protein n=1 Tax=Trichinella pseudospiralis TaxID=6337 RepID=A0A0V1FH32_TRIPS|nr:Sodium-driven chloride bicarbonate exchanger [Trichinella pseudospiralis]
MDDKKGAAVNETDDVVRDTKADEPNISDKDQMESRRSDIVWFGTGIHLPYDNDKAKEHIPLERRPRRRRPTLLVSKDSDRMTPVEEDRIAMAPSARVQQLLNQQKNGENLEWQPSHSLFTEMEFLYGSGPNQEWRETARRMRMENRDGVDLKLHWALKIGFKVSERLVVICDLMIVCVQLRINHVPACSFEKYCLYSWVKYEEDVEEGGNRWSKPHVATLSLHSLFELRSCLMNGVVILDLDATELETVIEHTIKTLLSEGLLKQSAVNTVREALLSKHKHQYEQNKVHKEGMSSGQSFLQTVRSIADIGRSLSHAKNMTPSVVESSAVSQIPAPVSPTALNVPDIGLNKLSGTALSAKQGSRVMDGSDITAKGNYHLYKKLPRGAEASNVLVGQLSSLDNYISAFIRLNKACHFNNLTEVPVPTRFMFILLGPEGHKLKYREIGRAISTLMSDEVFCDVAYQARNREDLLDGIDEFLEQVIVLPPGEWDPKIRIEPPTSVPSQEARKKLIPKKEDADGSQNNNLDDDIPGGHGKDIALKRTHKLFGGLMADIKRKVPWYVSDFKDAFNLQCVAAFLYMYFAMLAPIVTFGGLLEEATDRNLAAIENLFSGAICGTLYSLFAGQPLTMIGSTGPVLIFERVVFDLCKKASLDFLSVRFWINTWSGVILVIIVAFDASAMVSYITRFTEESFSALISFIFIYESIAKLIKILHSARIIEWNPLSATGGGGNCSCSGKPVESEFMNNVKTMISRRRMNASSWLFHQPDENISYIDWDNVPLEHCEYLNGQLIGDSCYYMLDVFLMSLVLLAGTFTIATVLKHGRNSSYFPTSVRTILSDFAVFIAISLMILLDYFVGLQTPKLYVPENFSPTLESRGWIVHPLPDPSTWWIIPLGIAPAVLLCILLFMDHQITVVIVNRKENKLKKGCGYHLDLLLIAIVCFITAFMGLPIFVAATVMSVSHVNALRVESECRAPGEKPKFIGVREQRVTGTLVFLFIGFSTLMTSVLKHIPMPVLYGVFLYMGVSSLKGVQMVDRLLLLFMPMKYQPDYIYLRHVPIRRVHLFTFVQITCFIIMCVVKEVEVTSVAFPLMLVVLVAIRKLLEYVFTEKELKLLDDKMPEITLRKREDAKKKRQKEQQEEANKLVPVQTTSNLHIPLASGHVMSIPLESLNAEEKVNLSEEVNRSGLWKHIASYSDMTKNMKKMKVNDQKELKTFAEEEDDGEAITISFDRAEETPSTEKKPLLNDTEPRNENDEMSRM